MPQNLTDRPVSAEEARAELDRVLHSPAFQRSDRLQKFLKFVSDLTLNGESSRINEYLIGSEVFQRGPDYSPNEDSIVRRQAHTLRRKLQEHYETDGSESTVRIELPTGGYIPVFRRQGETASTTAAPAMEPEAAEAQTVPAPARRRAYPIGAIVAAGLALLAIGWFFGRATK